MCMQCIPTYKDLCVDGSWWNLVGIRTCVFPVLASRCADGLWGLSPHQLNILWHRWSYVACLNGGLWGMSPHQRTLMMAYLGSSTHTSRTYGA